MKMKISQVKLSNFRCYQKETVVNFNDLTVFVGKNDIGKSTILEALDIFFNESKGSIKIDKDDINKDEEKEGNTEIQISVVFDDLPTRVMLDSTNYTTLADEYLINNGRKLEVIKTYPNAGKEKISIKANHPSNLKCSDLLLKKQTELKKIINTESIICSDLTKNAIMRNAIWTHYNDNLELKLNIIEVGKEDTKSIWEQLKNYMPLYSLFQSDRENSDGDCEIQDPMKLAVKEILKDEDIIKTLNRVAIDVNDKLKQVADRTLKKLNEMNPEIAETLSPIIPPYESLKWADVFKNVSISGDNNIPINKRGSGVKRLILLNFFRAEAEKRQKEKEVPNIIYAIEEPETSQHQQYQRKLIESFLELSQNKNTQIILTTHSPAIVKMLNFENLRLVKGETSKEVISVEENNLPYPSLNEVNFLAFGESDEGYHNELYGFIESECWLNEFKTNKPTIPYIQIGRNGTKNNKQKILSEYIRHQIHHPENTENELFSNEQLQKSIELMRKFISLKKVE
jgi:predicted ATP-dependent endonuclease of OLD family